MSPCLVVVLCMAVVMSGMAAFIGYLLGRRSATPARPAAAPALPRADGVTPELVAVLAAAAHAALGKPVVVRRLRVLRPAGQETWSRVGRIDILRSHRVDPKR